MVYIEKICKRKFGVSCAIIVTSLFYNKTCWLSLVDVGILSNHVNSCIFVCAY